MRILALLLLPLVACAQDFVQSPVEQLEAEMQAVWGGPIQYLEPAYDKAPIDAALDLSEPLRVVDADATPTRHDLVLHGVRLANWSQSAALPARVPRATVSFSPGLKVGSLDRQPVWSWRATVCNQTPFIQEIDAGDVEQAANGRNIATVGLSEAKAANAEARSHNRSVVAAQVTEGLAQGGTGLIAARVIAATAGWGAGAFVGSTLAGLAVNFFKGREPPEFSTRFADADLLVDNSSVSLSPSTDRQHCVTRSIFSRTKKGAAAQAGVPIY